MTTTAVTSRPGAALETPARDLARRWGGRHVVVTTPATPEEAEHYNSSELYMECVVEDVIVDHGFLVVVADYGMSLPVRQGSTIREIGLRD